MIRRAVRIAVALAASGIDHKARVRLMLTSPRWSAL